MNYRVQLDVFEGPLELLLHLLEQEELDIRDIEISRITQQYLEYLATMQEHDLEVAGDFLVMAATLLQIKAEALLPEIRVENETDEQDTTYSRDELVRRLLIYREFREAARNLGEIAQERQRVLPRPFSSLGQAGPTVFTNPTGDATVQDLAVALSNVLISWRAREEVQQIKRRKIDLGVRIGEVALLVQKRSRVFFDDLLGMEPTKTDIVYTFLAVLELVRQGAIVVYQDDIGEPIAIRTVKESGYVFSKGQSDPRSHHFRGRQSDPTRGSGRSSGPD